MIASNRIECTCILKCMRKWIGKDMSNLIVSHVNWTTCSNQKLGLWDAYGFFLVWFHRKAVTWREILSHGLCFCHIYKSISLYFSCHTASMKPTVFAFILLLHLASSKIALKEQRKGKFFGIFNIVSFPNDSCNGSNDLEGNRNKTVNNVIK